MEANSKIMLENVHEHLFPFIYVPIGYILYIYLSIIYA